MSTFNAAEVVEPLDYDFGRHADAKGTITDPSPGRVAEFGRALLQHQQRVNALAPELAADADTGDRLTALAELSESMEKAGAAREEAEIYAALCSGAPSADDIMSLPYRLRESFYAWLRDEITPNGATGNAGSAAAAAMFLAAAGQPQG